ncbi:MAG: hypothetical protein KJ955_08085 [Nanoarchaeota archaeon]|nr:hypothetical protein [Nanoarchaeota archaeon]
MDKLDNFLQTLKQLPEDEQKIIQSKNIEELDAAEREHQEFQNSFVRGNCYLCHLPLTAFDISKSCLHWLLNPEGFKKRYFEFIYAHYSYFQIESYLRWVANQEIPLQNINALSQEDTKNKPIELTICYKSLEWSFSCSESDLQGHKASRYGQFSHYHFQMRIAEKPFINYTDFHIPFTEGDLFKLGIIRKNYPALRHVFPFGDGMKEALNAEPDKLLENMQLTTDENKSSFHLQTVVTTEPGKPISIDKIEAMIKESQKTRKPLAALAHKYINDASVKVMISPGESVPEIAKRTIRHR